ncbi:MAG TPA: hypothetical protein VNO14_07815 [Blastocatellia bacterium]|nr:hypothetical protein [Blastocatellia bacterium]
MSLISANEVVAILLLYTGPDQILPLMSIIGTIIGVLLIWWQRFVMLVKKGWRFLSARMQSKDKKLEPSAKKGIS